MLHFIIQMERIMEMLVLIINKKILFYKDNNRVCALVNKLMRGCLFNITYVKELGFFHKDYNNLVYNSFFRR